MDESIMFHPQFSAEANASGIHWGAVIAGAFVTAALWLSLTILGVGLGLSAISPWTHAGASSTSLNVGAIIWLIVSQIIASSLGGYLAGRWRIKWPTVHTNEVFFRDTAHRFPSMGRRGGCLGSVFRYRAIGNFGHQRQICRHDNGSRL